MSILASFILPHPPLIIPEIGRGQEKIIHKTVESYMEVMEKVYELKPDTIIITSPHSICYSDYFHISPGAHAEGDFSQFNAGEVRIKVDYDEEFSSLLSNFCSEDNIRAGTLGERNKELDHGTMIPLYFLQKLTSDFKVVRIGLSGLPCVENYKLGMEIQKCAEKLDRRVVILASGDLSHCLKEDGPYGYHKEGPVFDKKVTEQMDKGDFKGFFEYDSSFLEKAEECGLGSFQIMAGALDKKSVESKLLSYEGPFGVGYGVASFIVKKDDASRDYLNQYQKEKNKRLEQRKDKEDIYVKLARNAVETYVKSNKIIDIPNGLPSSFTQEKKGVFVSIHKDGELRGCIGTFSPSYSCIGEEIIRNGVAACSEDHRFDRVMPYELDDLEYSVDVLSPFEKIESKSELDPKKYGVIVQSGYKRGLLLPNLEGVDLVNQQIDIAKRKAGINDNEKVVLYRFESVRHL